MPAVTVVIPTRDRIPVLLQTLASVCWQRDVDLEAIVVDEGSVADVGAAVASLSDPRLRVVRHARPLGVSSARNRGVEQARGHWVAFLDDDDLWAPTKLVEQLSALRRDGRAWSAAGAVSIDDSLQVLAGEQPLPAERMVADLPRYNSVPVGASNVLVERSVLARVGGFDTHMRHMSDWDMWIRLAGTGLPSVVSRPLVAYRLHASAATMDTALDPSEPLAELAVIARRHRIPADRAAVLRWIAWTALRRGRRWVAVRSYAAAVRDGDLRSLGRLGIALVHPGVGKRVFFRPFMRRGLDEEWMAEARSWLHDLASASSDPSSPLTS